MQVYLNTLEGGPSGPMHDGYAELCNITHPAADSVLYLRERGSDGSIAFCTTADEEAIVELCERGGTVFAYALSESLKYPVMILKIVNPFQPEKQRKRLLKGDCALLLNQDQLLERLDVAVGPFRGMYRFISSHVLGSR